MLQHYTTHNFSVAYSEYGSPEGFPILVQHGLIASIKDGGLFERLTKAGAKVICVARPGYGESSPYEMGSIGEWGQMVAGLVHELNLNQFDVLDMSSGAPYSYAVGYGLSDKVRNIFIFSGIPAMYDDRVSALWPHPITKNADLVEMKKLAYGLFFSNLAAEDRARNDTRDSMMYEGFGIALDFRLRCVDWGFKLGEIKQPVVMRHARFDPGVPLTAVEMTAALLPKAKLIVEETDIHFSQETLDAYFESEIIPRLPDRM
jgi:pimeloyl-ACP methyl ester carboxylesterase